MSGAAGIARRPAAIAPLVLALVPAAPSSAGLATFQDTKAEKAISLARAVPNDALFFVQVTSLDSLRAEFRASAWHDFYQDEDLEELRESIDKWIEIPGKEFEAREGRSLHSTLGVDPWEFLGSLHGSIACFATLDGGGSEQAGGVLFVPGADRGKFEEVFATLQESEGEHRVRSTAEYGGVELTLFEAPTGANPDDSEEVKTDPRHSTYFDAGEWAGILTAATREDLLALVHNMIDRMRGGDPAPGFEDSEVMSSARASVSAPGRIEVFVDLKSILTEMRESDPTDEGSDRIRDALALDDLRWVYATADVGSGEKFGAELSLRLPDTGYLREWFGFLSPYPQEMAAIAPRASTSISLAQCDVRGLWESVWRMMGELEPEATEKARDQMTTMLRQMGDLDIEKDLISQLDGRFLTFNIPVPPEEARTSWSAQFKSSLAGRMDVDVPNSMIQTGSAFVLGLRDANVVSRFLQGVLMAVGAQPNVETEEFQGTTIQRLSAGPTGIEWAFTKTTIVVSQYPTALRAALRMEGAETKDSALEVETFKPLYAAHADAAVLGLADTAVSLKAGLNVLEMIGPFMARNMMREHVQAGGEGELPNPFEHLPSAAAIERHFKGTLVTSVTRSSGVLHFQVKTQ